MASRHESPKLPGIESLRAVAGALRGSQVTFALGGSGLLCALDLAGEARDWDLTTDVEYDRVLPSVALLRPEPFGPSGIHGDRKLRFDGGTVELIVEMALRVPSGVCRIPTIVTGEWNGVPVGSPEAWAVAYWLMGRAEKADLLLRHLRGGGADRRVVDRLLREPLPAELAAALRGL